MNVFRQVVKSIAVFSLGVFVARELANAELNPPEACEHAFYIKLINKLNK